MTVTCDDCGLVYDDTYRWTYCPHDKFEMRSLVSNGRGTKICTTVEEVNTFLREGEKRP